MPAALVRGQCGTPAAELLWSSVSRLAAQKEGQVLSTHGMCAEAAILAFCPRCHPNGWLVSTALRVRHGGCGACFFSRIVSSPLPAPTRGRVFANDEAHEGEASAYQAPGSPANISSLTFSLGHPKAEATPCFERFPPMAPPPPRSRSLWQPFIRIRQSRCWSPASIDREMAGTAQLWSARAVVKSRNEAAVVSAVCGITPSSSSSRCGHNAPQTDVETCGTGCSWQP